MLDVIGTADTELLAKEGYSANRFLQLITQGLSQLPRVTENIRNELSNLKNEIFFMSAGIGKLLLPTLKHVTNAITTVVKMINGWSDAKKKFLWASYYSGNGTWGISSNNGNCNYVYCWC